MRSFILPLWRRDAIAAVAGGATVDDADASIVAGVAESASSESATIADGGAVVEEESSSTICGFRGRLRERRPPQATRTNGGYGTARGRGNPNP